jgi:hypothetical protein
MFEERLLGFDIREHGGAPDQLWDHERRERFLLRVDSPKPLSIDTSVWPSFFDTGQGIGLPGPERERLHLDGVPVPGTIGPNAGLWEDTARMRLYYKEWAGEPKPGVVVAISWISDNSFLEGGEFGPYLGQTSPAECDPLWERCGFDVGDGSLVSGLSNCGYLPDEAASLRKRWRESLNKHHLFDVLLPAFRFRDLSNERVPSHAPFFVYGLYLVGSFARAGDSLAIEG